MTASGNTVTVYQSPAVETMSLDIWSTIIIQIIRNISTSVHSDNFIKHNASQHVYAVSVQALSTPSALSGPVTVRGQLEYSKFGSKCT